MLPRVRVWREGKGVRRMKGEGVAGVLCVYDSKSRLSMTPKCRKEDPAGERRRATRERKLEAMTSPVSEERGRFLAARAVRMGAVMGTWPTK